MFSKYLPKKSDALEKKLILAKQVLLPETILSLLINLQERQLFLKPGVPMVKKVMPTTMMVMMVINMLTMMIMMTMIKIIIHGLTDVVVIVVLIIPPVTSTSTLTLTSTSTLTLTTLVSIFGSA